MAPSQVETVSLDQARGKSLHRFGIEKGILLKMGLVGLLLSACQAKFLKIENEGELAKIAEYDEKVKVKALPLEAEIAKGIAPPSDASTAPREIPTPDPTPEKDSKKKKPKPKPTPVPVPKKREPELEDSTGFQGRRPMKDPFWIGEKVTLEISYFGAKAGDMTMEVRPFLEVNGRKSYHLVATLKSSSFFSTFYSADDYGETFLDYQDLIPFNFAVKVKESAQLREVRSFFDWKLLKASFWEKKVTKKKGTEEKKLEWDIPTYSQNVFSAPFYLRTFQFVPGKEISFRVADENRNMIVKAKILRKETVEVEAGKFNTVVIQPEIAMEGIFQPMGDVFFWLTDDDRKLFVKIEAKIRIGSLKGEAREIQYGLQPTTPGP